MAESPSISILMSAYNASDTLTKSIDSILSQSFTDFEFIIIDDGSTDETTAILEEYAQKDPRIHVVTQDNTGLTIALNRGLKLAKGRYVVRQDTDDFSYPDRLQKQFDLMETRPDILLCGGNCNNLYPGGLTTQWGWEPEEILQKSVFIKTPFAHSTAMMRTDVARALGGYDESFKTAQDMEFWMRFAKAGPIAMVSDPLVLRTVSGSSISTKRRWRQFYDAFRVRWQHNENKPLIIYHSIRSLLIGFLPESVIALKRNLTR